MSSGEQLGAQLRLWLDRGEVDLRHGQAIANRWIDALGSDDSLKAPLRDLAARPLFLQALKVKGPAQRAGLEQLRQELSRIYSPAVMQELADLLSSLCGEPLSEDSPSVRAAGEPTGSRPASVPLRQARERLRHSSSLEQLHRLAPGIALAAAASLVGMWLGHELERLIFRPWEWNGSVVLVVALALVEILKESPLGEWLRKGTLNTASAGSETQGWRWLLAPWLHPSRIEAVLCLLLLLAVLGSSPLPLAAVTLRYLLTSLAALIPAVVVARKAGLSREWGGAAGVVGALIGLGAMLSLLQWRVLTFQMAGLSLPAWMLLLLFSTAEVIRTSSRWELDEEEQPVVTNRQRLLSEPWLWGLLLGASWGLITWLGQLLERFAPGQYN